MTRMCHARGQGLTYRACQMSERRSTSRFDVVVIGGGQAGLAVGHHLARLSLSFIILDAHDRVGDSWRERWDSLRLFTPARLNGLPGMPFPAAPGTTATKDAMADYLESYAKRFKLPVCLQTTADTLTRDRGQFMLRAGSDSFGADQVVVATGGHPVPTRPGFAGARSGDPAAACCRLPQSCAAAARGGSCRRGGELGRRDRD
jgi:cation diffusion facilitator CzcD-associated flavoprotein CzcO